jgi:hypothetical protein
VEVENNTRKSLKLNDKGVRNAADQEYKEWKNKEMRSSVVLSLFLNCLSLRSLHKHYIRQQGTIFHTTALRERPPVHQQANKSTTRRGITQDKLKRLKMAFHKARATSQWRRRWSTNSPFILHMQHLSITITRFFLRLSKVRNFPCHYKKLRLGQRLERQRICCSVLGWPLVIISFADVLLLNAGIILQFTSVWIKWC